MEDDYICLALIIHLVIMIVVVVDWRMNLLNEVEVLTTRLSEDIFRPTHHKTNLKQGHIYTNPVCPRLTDVFLLASRSQTILCQKILESEEPRVMAVCMCDDPRFIAPGFFSPSLDTEKTWYHCFEFQPM